MMLFSISSILENNPISHTKKIRNYFGSFLYLREMVFRIKGGFDDFRPSVETLDQVSLQMVRNMQNDGPIHYFRF
jgi:hypothetical protein